LLHRSTDPDWGLPRISGRSSTYGGECGPAIGKTSLEIGAELAPSAACAVTAQVSSVSTSRAVTVYSSP